MSVRWICFGCPLCFSWISVMYSRSSWLSVAFVGVFVSQSISCEASSEWLWISLGFHWASIFQWISTWYGWVLRPAVVVPSSNLSARYSAVCVLWKNRISDQNLTNKISNIYRAQVDLRRTWVDPGRNLRGWGWVSCLSNVSLVCLWASEVPCPRRPRRDSRSEIELDGDVLIRFSMYAGSVIFGCRHSSDACGMYETAYLMDSRTMGVPECILRMQSFLLFPDADFDAIRFFLLLEDTDFAAAYEADFAAVSFFVCYMEWLLLLFYSVACNMKQILLLVCYM